MPAVREARYEYPQRAAAVTRSASRILVSTLTWVLLFGCQEPEVDQSLNDRARAIVARYEEQEGGRMEGIVRLFNRDKAYGLIEISGDDDAPARSIFFDYSSIAGETYERLAIGNLVSFEFSESERGPKARDVSIVPTQQEREALRTAFAQELAYVARYCSPDKDNECRVRRVIAASLGIPFQQATREIYLVENLGADSLHIVELVMAMEEEFDLEIPDKDLERMPTVGETIDYIARRRQESGDR